MESSPQARPVAAAWPMAESTCHCRTARRSREKEKVLDLVPPRTNEAPIRKVRICQRILLRIKRSQQTAGCINLSTNLFRSRQ